MTETTSFLYFAYGSNMLTRRLRARTPSARMVGVAALAGFEVRWHKVSRDGSAKCDIVPAADPGTQVFGVVYEIDAAEKPALDHAEGLGRGYKERPVEVSADAGTIVAMTYQATNVDHLALPFGWYKALVVAGAKEHALPEAYVQGLGAVRTKPDPDPDREAENFQLACAG